MPPVACLLTLPNNATLAEHLLSIAYQTALTRMKPSAPAQHSTDEAARPRMARLVERERARLTFNLDGAPATALEGDTILTAVLTTRRYLVESGFDGKRAGFCLMGACQECWVAVDGARARACSTLVTAGMAVATGGHSPGG